MNCYYYLFIYCETDLLEPNQNQIKPKKKNSLLSPRDGVFSAGHFHVMK